MFTVNKREALTDLSRFLRDMYCWCDQDGSYTTGLVSVTRGTIKEMRRCVDAVLDADNHDGAVKCRRASVYAALSESTRLGVGK